jgi:hypothetical protein
MPRKPIKEAASKRTALDIGPVKGRSVPLSDVAEVAETPSRIAFSDPLESAPSTWRVCDPAGSPAGTVTVLEKDPSAATVADPSSVGDEKSHISTVVDGLKPDPETSRVFPADSEREDGVNPSVFAILIDREPADAVTVS